MNSQQYVFFRKLILLVFFFLLLPAVEAAFSTTDGLDAQTLDVLQELSERAKDVQFIRSDFRQEKFVSFMDEKLVSTGDFTFNFPDELSWQYKTPVASGLVYKSGKAALWTAEQGGPDQVELRSDGAGATLAQVIARQIILWTSLDLEKLRQEYAVRLLSAEPVKLELVPNRKVKGMTMERFLVEFAQNGMDIERITFFERDGDYTRIDFFNTQRR